MLVEPCWCVEWYNTVIISCLVSNVHFNCIVQFSLYHNIDIGTMWHCALASCSPSQSIGVVIGWLGVVLVLSVICAPFTISLIDFQFIMVFIMTVGSNNGTFMVIFTFRTTPLGFLLLSSTCPANVQLPGCFRPRTFALDIGMDMLPSDSFMFTVPTREFHRGVPGFATDGPCDVWCRRFTTCLLYDSPLCGNLA